MKLFLVSDLYHHHFVQMSVELVPSVALRVSCLYSILRSQRFALAIELP